MSTTDSKENTARASNSVTVSVERAKHEIEGCRETVYRVMLRYCGNSSDAEDLTQEALLKSLQSAHLYRGRARVCTWVVTIATYCYLTRVRKRVPPLSGVLGHEESGIRLEEQEPVLGAALEKDPHQQAEIHERARRLREAIQALPQEDQLVITFYHLEEYGYDEIAALLEISPAAVKMRAMRARKKLRQTLEKQGDIDLFMGL